MFEIKKHLSRGEFYQAKVKLDRAIESSLERSISHYIYRSICQDVLGDFELSRIDAEQALGMALQERHINAAGITMKAFRRVAEAECRCGDFADAAITIARAERFNDNTLELNRSKGMVANDLLKLRSVRREVQKMEKRIDPEKLLNSPILSCKCAALPGDVRPRHEEATKSFAMIRPLPLLSQSQQSPIKLNLLLSPITNSL